MAQMTEDELRAMTDVEIRNSMGYMTGLLSEQRRRALYYYLGEAKGDLAPPEVTGRSTIVSSDVMDTIEWMLPSLISVFTASDEVVQFEPTSPQDEEAAKQATDWSNHVFYKQNDGFKVLYTWFKDALLEKNGIVKCYWEENKTDEKEKYQGITDDQLKFLLADDNVTLSKQTSYPDPAQPQIDPMTLQMMQAHGQQAPPTMLHDVTIKRTTDDSKICIENVPPEEFLINRDAKDIESARFVGHRVLKTLSKLKEMGYDVDNDVTSDESGEFNAERYERKMFDDENAWTNPGSPDESQKSVWITECYPLVDWDGDGIAERRKVVRAGNKILENEEWEGPPPFASISPILMPHRFYGLSIADIVMDIQRIKTALLRQLLDNMYLQNNGRYAVLNGRVNLDDFLNSRPGGAVRVDQMDAIQPLTVQPLGAWAIQSMEYIDTIKESRTSVTKYNQGLDANSLNKTATGISSIMSASQKRIELIARLFANGMKDLFRLILEFSSKYSTKSQIIRLRGNWVEIDPREWKTMFDMTVTVGLGTGNKDQMLQHLNAIAMLQEKIGQYFPGMVSPENAYNMAVKVVENSGFKNAEQFFTDPTKNPPPPPKPGPDEIAAQRATEQQQMKVQSEQQIAMGKQQVELERIHKDFIAKMEATSATLQANREKIAAMVGMANEDRIAEMIQQQNDAHTQMIEGIKDAVQNMPKPETPVPQPIHITHIVEQPKPKKKTLTLPNGKQAVFQDGVITLPGGKQATVNEE